MAVEKGNPITHLVTNVWKNAGRIGVNLGWRKTRPMDKIGRDILKRALLKRKLLIAILRNVSV